MENRVGGAVAEGGGSGGGARDYAIGGCEGQLQATGTKGAVAERAGRAGNIVKIKS